jgi:hypothetical protein
MKLLRKEGEKVEVRVCDDGSTQVHCHGIAAAKTLHTQKPQFNADSACAKLHRPLLKICLDLIQWNRFSKLRRRNDYIWTFTMVATWCCRSCTYFNDRIHDRIHDRMMKRCLTHPMITKITLKEARRRWWFVSTRRVTMDACRTGIAVGLSHLETKQARW